MRAALVDDWVSRLPHGLDSYPDCTCKVSTNKVFYERYLERFPNDPLPAALADTAIGRPVSDWVSEVRSMALHLSIAARFDDDDAFLAWARESNRALLEGPLYRALFLVIGPRRVATAAADRWARFHRGVRIEAIARDGGTTFVMHYPPRLVPELIARAYATAFDVAIGIAGATEGSFVLSQIAETEATFTGRWR